MVYSNKQMFGSSKFCSIKNLSVTLVILCICGYCCAENSSTTVHLKTSVNFSHSLANAFLDFIRGNASVNATVDIVRHAIDLSSNKFSLHYVTPVFIHYPGYTGCIVFGLIFAIFMPIIGLFFCCLRCCGRCGGRAHLMEKKKDPCRRVSYTILMAIITTLQLLAIILALINHHLQYTAGTSKDIEVGTIPQLVDSTFRIETAIQDIISAAKNTSTVDLEGQKRRFDALVDDRLTEFQQEFIRNKIATTIINLVNEFQQIVFNYSSSPPKWREFANSLKSLQSSLPIINADISEKLDYECEIPVLTQCREIENMTKRYLVVNFTPEKFQLAEMEQLLGDLDSLRTDVQDLHQFNNAIHGIKSKVKLELTPILDDTWTNMSSSLDTRQQFTESIEKFAIIFQNHLKLVRENLTEHLNKPNKPYFHAFGEYYLYVGIAILCLPLLIILLWYLGLCFGTCGDRPYEEASLCNRGVGANLLMSGVAFSFMFATFLMIVCTVIFLYGGLAQTEACRYLTSRYPNGPRVIDDTVAGIVSLVNRPDGSTTTQMNVDSNLNNFLKLNVFEMILTKCSQESLVNAVGYENIGWMISNKSINAVLENVLETFNLIDLISPLKDASTSTQSTLNKLERLRNTNFTVAIAQCDEPLTKIADLKQYINRLRSLNVMSISNSIQSLEDNVASFTEQLKSIKRMYMELNSLHTIFLQLTENLEKFTIELDSTIPTLIQKQINDMYPLFLKEYRFAVIATWRDIPCTNLNSAAVSTVNAVCTTYIGPLNGFWVGLGFYLLLLIPGIMCAVKLVNLYRKVEKFSADYEEPDYISYHGFYMRPTSDIDIQNPRKRRPRKDYKTKNSNSLLNNAE